MRWVAVRQSPTGVIAIGQVPTGIVAIGQGATGVIAIGQLARGVVAIGQLVFGQVAIGAGWAGGMLAAGGADGPTLLGWGLFGHLPLRSLRRADRNGFEPRRMGGRSRVITIVAWLAVAIATWFVALAPLLDDLVREGGIVREPACPRVLR